MSDSSRELMVELVEVAREQLRWQRASTIPSVRAALDEALTTTAMRRAYELCDGSRTFRDISKEAGVAIGTLSGWSRRWREQGLAYEESGGRLRHLIGLEALGLPIEIVGVAPAPGRR
jgi:hypothetical protein